MPPRCWDDHKHARLAWDDCLKLCPLWLPLAWHLQLTTLEHHGQSVCGHCRNKLDLVVVGTSIPSLFIDAGPGAQALRIVRMARMFKLVGNAR